MLSRMVESLESRTLLSGQLDPGFGVGGIARYPSDSFQYTVQLLVDTDGMIYVRSRDWDTETRVSRINAGGVVDRNYGPNGSAVTFPDSYEPNAFRRPGAMILDHEHRILECGIVAPTGGKPNLEVVRLNTDGSPDQSFGTFGRSLVIQPAKRAILGTTFGIVEDSTGRLVVGFAGSGWDMAHDSYNDSFLVRLLPNGSLDRTFGRKGYVALKRDGTRGFAGSMTSDNQGRIVLSGFFYDTTWPSKDDAPNRLASIGRYLADGKADQTFGDKGWVIEHSRSDSLFSAPSIDSKNRIVVQADRQKLNGSVYNREIGISRYMSDGTLDSSFATQGTFAVSIGGGRAFPDVDSVFVQPDNRVVALRSTHVYPAQGPSNSYDIIRLDVSGRLDKTFAHDGIRATDGATGAPWVFAFTSTNRLLLGSDMHNQLVDGGCDDCSITAIYAGKTEWLPRDNPVV